MVCRNCELCYKIELDSGGVKVYKRKMSKLSSIWFDSLGNSVTDPAIVAELESKAIDDNLFDCQALDSGRESGVAYPTFIDPYATLENNCGDIYEVGTPVSLITCLTAYFNKGAIILNGTKQNDRAGNIIPSESYIFLNNDTTQRTVPEYVPLGDTLFTYRASYEEGPQPKDSFGNNYGYPLPAGYVDSNTVKIIGVTPIFATVTNCQTLDKLPLIHPKEKTIEFLLAPETDGKQSFMIPEDRSLEGIYVFNPFTNNFEETFIDLYYKNEEIKGFNGVDVGYTRYIFIGYKRSNVRMKLKFK